MSDTTMEALELAIKMLGWWEDNHGCCADASNATLDRIQELMPDLDVSALVDEGAFWHLSFKP